MRLLREEVGLLERREQLLDKTEQQLGEWDRRLALRERDLAAREFRLESGERLAEVGGPRATYHKSAATSNTAPHSPPVDKPLAKKTMNPSEIERMTIERMRAGEKALYAATKPRKKVGGVRVNLY